jgi:hypothetical protein
MVALAPAATHTVPGPVLYVGDSLGVATLPRLVTALPRVSFDGDAAVGRTSAQGLTVLRARMLARHRVVIFDLGTNDPDPAALTRSLRGLRHEAGNREIVVFTINKPGAEPYNHAIKRFAAPGDGVVVLDWHATAVRERLLAGDCVHASVSGYARRARLVAGCLSEASIEPSPAS